VVFTANELSFAERGVCENWDNVFVRLDESIVPGVDEYTYGVCKTC
jgi:hypothetical protein